MEQRTRDALVAQLGRYETLVEVGVGRTPDVAAALAARRLTVTATDVHPVSVPEGIRFVRDDVTAPDHSVYEGADVVYALNLPPELQRPAFDVARRAGADFLFTTLGTDPTLVPAQPSTLPGETLFRARDVPGGAV